MKSKSPLNLLIRAFSTFLFLICLVSCTEDLESAKFNAYFYDSNNKEEFLGTVKGLSACQAAASARARTAATKENWDYICCLKTNSSECKSKHK